MNRSKGFSAKRVLALIAMFLGMILTTFVSPAYGQQEVDPSWYNPWQSSNTTEVQAAQPRSAKHQRQSKVKSARSQRLAKVRGKASKRPTA